LSDGEILSNAYAPECLILYPPKVCGSEIQWPTLGMSAARKSASTLSLIHFQPEKQPPKPLSPSEIPSDEEFYGDSELFDIWKPQSASARARVETHTGDYQAAPLSARETPTESRIDPVARQAVSTQHRFSF